MLNKTIDSDVEIISRPLGDDSDVSDYTLSDFESKECFLKCLFEDVNKRFGFPSDDRTSVGIDYASVPENFELLGLIEDGEISELVWDVLKLEDEVIEMLAAYVKLNGFEVDEDGNKDLDATLSVATDSFSGNFRNPADWGYNELEARGAMQGLHPIIENNLDIDAIVAEMKMAGSIKVVDTEAGCFYFG